ncbi:MAG: DUF58 domain-containing protein [Solirubrobacteraceae bacterium]
MRPPRLLARRALTVTGAGTALVLIALLFDAAPLFVPAVALTLIGLATPAWVWLSLAGARVSRQLPTERVVEDQPLTAIIEVRHGLLGLPGAEVVDPLTGSRLRVGGPLSVLTGGRSTRVRVVTRFARRGLHTLQAPSLVVRDPLELARVERVSAMPAQQLLVLPRTEPVRWLAVGRGRRLRVPDGHATTEALAAVDLDGLRPYRPGAPASRIHWPALARGAGLIERRLRADGDTRPLIVLDARLPSPATPESDELLDAAVRAAASLTLELARAGGCGLLLPGEQRPTTIDAELTTWPAAYARLAVVQAAGARAPALGPGAGRIGPMVYVAVRAPERLTAANAEGAKGSIVLVVPSATVSAGRPRGVRGPARATLEVSGCQGFVLGARRAPERARPQPRATMS